MPNVWNTITSSVTLMKPVAQYDAWVTKGGDPKLRWVIGSYKTLRELAPALRTDAALWGKYGAFDARLGRRDSDRSPLGVRTHKSFRSAIEGVPANKMGHAEKTGIAHRADGNATRRITEQWDAAADYFDDATLEAHHIVEKSILGVIGKNNGDLDNAQAPCVLIAAELHRRLYTSEVAGSRDKFSPSMGAGKARTQLTTIYNDLYSDPKMGDLKAIADIIIKAI